MEQSDRFTKHLRLIAIASMTLNQPNGSRPAVRESNALLAKACIPTAPVEGRALYEWENSRGGSLRKSVAYVVHYALGDKTREKWKNSRVGLHHRRAEASIEHYQAGRRYDPQRRVS